MSNLGYLPDLSTPCFTYCDILFTLIQMRFSPTAFAAFNEISSWRFRHLNIVGCLVIKRLQRQDHGHPRTHRPVATPLQIHERLKPLDANILAVFFCRALRSVYEATRRAHEQQRSAYNILCSLCEYRLECF